ncbi:hypothetical protein JW992_03720 [candidate division KSB1 bacterium]|nr:hypothetical protein [candidate division KSB1 bacterium]
MKKLLLFWLISSVGCALAATSELRLLVAQNDLAVDGEFRVDVQVRVPEGETGQTLNSLTADVSYGSGLTTPTSGTIDTGWFTGFGDYECSADALSGKYRVLVTGNQIGKSGAGTPAGLAITTTWQTIVTLRWRITQVKNFAVTLLDETDAAGYFVNSANNPEDDAADWDNSPHLASDLKLAAKVFLEGPYAGSEIMTTDLRDNDFIPTTSPYLDQRVVASIPGDITDWLQVELRSNADGPAVAIHSAFLHKNGSLVADDGTTAEITVPSAEGNKDYFIVLRHRNHIPVMSASALALSDATTGSHDFTTSAAQYRSSKGVLVEGPSVYGMFAADVTNDGAVIFADDITLVRNENLWIGYYDTDVTMNGAVIFAEDITLIRKNNLNFATPELLP